MAQGTFISFFHSALEPIPESKLTNEQYIEYIKEGKWKSKVEDYRNGKIQKKYLPLVTPSGLFSKRDLKNLISASGRMVADVDAKSNPGLDFGALLEQLKKDPTVEWAHVSVSGRGLAVCHLVPRSKEKFGNHFLALENYYLHRYNVIIDPACKDITRARFISYDPEAYFNKTAQPFTQIVEDNKNPEKSTIKVDLTNNEIDQVIQKIIDEEIDITTDYEVWVKICFSLIAKYKDEARGRFHKVSQFYPNYNEMSCDRQFDQCLEHYNKTRDDSVSIKTFLYYAKEAGIPIINENLEQVKEIAAIFTSFSRDKEELKSRYKDQAELDAIDEVYDMRRADKNNLIKYTRRIDILKIIVDHLYDVKFNEITETLLVEGQPLRDEFLDKIRMNLLDFMGLKFAAADIQSIFNSVKLTNPFNPFKRFIQTHQNIDLNGVDYFKEITSCLDADMEPDLLYKFFKSWYLGMISSIHGTHSILVLIFSGGQGIGKTQFFRNLLPDDLREYFTTKGIDKTDKDDLRLMTEKLIILDDEYTGKTRREVKDFKELVSKDEITYRPPYGRYPIIKKRLCVFAGTTNTTELLEDFTGNRRIIPIQVNDIDLPKFEAIDKNKLFIQAYNEWSKIGNDWMLKKEDVKNLNDVSGRFKIDIAEEELLKIYTEPADIKEDECYLVIPSVLLGYLQTKTGVRLNPKRLHAILNFKGYDTKTKKLRGKAGRFIPINFANDEDFKEFLQTINERPLTNYTPIDKLPDKEKDDVF